MGALAAVFYLPVCVDHSGNRILRGGQAASRLILSGDMGASDFLLHRPHGIIWGDMAVPVTIWVRRMKI